MANRYRIQTRKKKNSPKTVVNAPHSQLPSRSFNPEEAIANSPNTTVAQSADKQATFDFSNIDVVQPKLTIGEPDDKYEQEADQVATEVVQRINDGSLEEQEDIQRSTVDISRVALQCSQGVVSGPADSVFEAQLNQARHGGSPLEPKLRGQMETAMGTDFSQVKVHTDVQSDQLNRSIQAKAFTTGQDVFFSQGAYNPSSSNGQELIAHELTHVVQQGAPTLQQKSATNEQAIEGGQSTDNDLSLQRKKLQITNSDSQTVRRWPPNPFKSKGPKYGKLNEQESFDETDEVTQEQQQEDDVDGLGTVEVDDDTNVEIGSDGVKITIADHEITLSRSQLQYQGNIEEGVDASTGYSVTFPVPLGPLAPLALTLTLGFKAGVGATLSFTGQVVGDDSDASLHVEGEGKANANASAYGGIGVGVSGGVASAAAELQAALTSEAEGSLKVEGDAATGSGLVNAGTKAEVSLAGAIKAALQGAVTLSVAIFSKDFSVTFKEWVLGSADWKKTIVDIGQREPFLPKKSDLGVQDNSEQDIFKAIQPQPTATQKRWIAKLYGDYQTAVAAAEKLKEEGVDIEGPDFWDIVDEYDNQTVYVIKNKRIIKATGTEVMPLMSTHLTEQMLALNNIQEES